MPGLLIGLLFGFFLDSPLVVIPAIILANAFIYYGIVRGILLLRGRKDAAKPTPAR